MDKIISTLTEKPIYHWIITACLGALLILIILLIVIKTKEHIAYKNKKNYIHEAMLENATEEELAEINEEVVIKEEKEVEHYETSIETIPELKEENHEPSKKSRVVNGKYEVYSDGRSFYYSLKASNGEVLIKSQPYATKDSVLLAIDAIKRNIEVGKLSVREDKHGLFQFVLVAKNHRTLVMSANYPTEKRAYSASESFKRFAATSPIVEIADILSSDREEVKLENVIDKKGGKLGVVATVNGYYYILKASNGEVLVHSDIYKSETSVNNAVDRFKEAVFEGKFFIEKDKRDNYQFKLYGKNGRLVCVGHIYATKALAVASVNSVRSFVKMATNISE